MKKFRAFVLLVVILALSVAFIACDSGVGSSDEGGDADTSIFGGLRGKNPIPGVLTFSRGEGLNKVEVTITEKKSRAAYLPKDGDYYVIKVGGNIISQGTVTLDPDSDPENEAYTFIFKPDNTSPDSGDSDYSFKATFEFGSLTFDAPIIPDNGGDPVKIPTLYVDNGSSDGDNAGNVGEAGSEPEETDTTIAGMSYSAKDEGSYESHGGSGVGWHYLIPEDFDTAYNALKELWGNPNWDSEDPDNHFWGDEPNYAPSGDSSIVNELKAGGEGVLLVVINPDSEDKNRRQYQLAVWVTAEIGSMKTEAWQGVRWDGSNPKVTAPKDDDSDDENLTIGVLQYTRKVKSFDYDNTGDPPTYVEWTNYILSISFADALDGFKSLWGNPKIGWGLTGGKTNTSAAYKPGGVVFEITIYKDQEERITGINYRLVRVEVKGERKRWRGVGWNLVAD